LHSAAHFTGRVSPVLGLKGGYRNHADLLLKSREGEDRQMSDNHELTAFHDFAEAVGNAIIRMDPAKRALLEETRIAWIRSFPEDYLWATGPQAPALLYRLIAEIEIGLSGENEECDFDLASVPAQGRA
jgi:hypothetical protein